MRMIKNKQFLKNFGLRTAKFMVLVCAIFFIQATANAQFVEDYQLYRLVAQHSNKCVDVSEISETNGQAVWQWKCLNTANQTWEFVARGSGSYLIRARHSGKCLDVQNARTDNGAPVIQYDCHYGDNQLWSLIPIGTNYMITSKQSGKCMDVRGPSVEDKAIIQIWACNPANKNQIFNLSRAFNGDQQKSFQLIFASDPQYAFCESAVCQSNAKDSKTANDWHSQAINKLMAANFDIKGVVVNGDLTNVMRQEQIDVFENFYARKFVVFPGLGNHDYENYTPAKNDNVWGVCDGNATSANGAVCNLFQYFAKTVRANKYIQSFDWSDSDKWSRSGSFAYYWDIGNYRFIQLNNFPVFSYKFSNYASNKVGNENFDIQSALPWLRKILSQSKNKQVILNMHSINSSDSFGDAKWSAGRQEFTKILSENPNIKVIFAGHLHNLVGNYKSSKIDVVEKMTEGWDSFGGVPVRFSGSAEYNLFLLVKFDGTKITQTVYKSSKGMPGAITSTEEIK